MTLRRTIVGSLILIVFSTWCWCRPGGTQAQARPAETHYVHAEAEFEESAGNRDDQLYRFRTNQARHWRHVMIGGR